MYGENKQKQEFAHGNGFLEDGTDKISIPAEWEFFVKTLNRKRKDVSNRLTKWYAIYYI